MALSLSMMAFSEANERSDLEPSDALDIVDGQHVERVGHGQEQLVFQAGDGDDLVIMGHLAGQQFRHLQRDAQPAEANGRGVEDRPIDTAISCSLT